ncbi:hypothetical protein [Metabacillus idriensis]
MKKMRKHLFLLALGMAILLSGCSKAEKDIQTADEEWPRIIKAHEYS